VTRASVVTIEQRQSDYAALLQQMAAVDALVQLDATGREQLRSRRSRSVVRTAPITPAIRDSPRRCPRRVVVAGRFPRDEPFMMMSLPHAGRNAGVTVAEINLRFLADS